MGEDGGQLRQTAAVRDHLANERTMLAWVRTAITVIGLGFLVGRLLAGPSAPVAGVILSVVLVLVGSGSAVLGLRRFLAVEQQIDSSTYRPSVTSHVVLSGVIAMLGLLLAIALIFWPAS